MNTKNYSNDIKRTSSRISFITNVLFFLILLIGVNSTTQAQEVEDYTNQVTMKKYEQLNSGLENKVVGTNIEGNNSASLTKCSYFVSALAAGELAVGQTKTVEVHAKYSHVYTGIFMRANQTFQFYVASDDLWANNGIQSNANGYTGGIFDAGRRHGEFKMMALLGEIFSRNNDAAAYTGTFFKIGTGGQWTSNRTGFLVCFANDVLGGYNDNSKKLTLKVKRIN